MTIDKTAQGKHKAIQDISDRVLNETSNTDLLSLVVPLGGYENVFYMAQMEKDLKGKPPNYSACLQYGATPTEAEQYLNEYDNQNGIIPLREEA